MYLHNHREDTHKSGNHCCYSYLWGEDLRSWDSEEGERLFPICSLVLPASFSVCGVQILPFTFVDFEK